MPSDATANLELPFILPSQAQKHVTHNEALQRLDLVAQLTIAGERGEPLEAPDEGALYLVAANATGDWQQKSGQLAAWQDGSWAYLTPKPGWRAFDLERQRHVYHDGTTWKDLPLPKTATFDSLGIQASTDETNRLAVSSSASLFNHAGSDHRLTVNKANTAATASIVFQSGWIGRAEMGLAGEDSFSIKVNGDATGWRQAITISSEGYVRFDQRPYARASLAAATLTLAAGSATGFDQLHLAGGGVSLGTALTSGHGSSLRIPASGLYMVVLSVSTLSTTAQTVHVSPDGTSNLISHVGTAGTASNSAILWLDAGSELHLHHASAGQFAFGYGKTELCLAML